MDVPDLSDEISMLERSFALMDKERAGEIIERNRSLYGPRIAIEHILVPALERIGAGWEAGSYSLSQVYMSGKAGESIINGLIEEGEEVIEQGPKVAMAVLEDHHTLGKRIVISVLKSAGINVRDYGHALRAEDLVHKVVSDEIDILLISTLMLPAALRTKVAIESIKSSRPKTKVIVGGAPFLFDNGLWTEVGADAMGRTASESLEIVRNMRREATS